MCNAIGMWMGYEGTKVGKNIKNCRGLAHRWIGYSGMGVPENFDVG
jgi:hypothetical protein